MHPALQLFGGLLLFASVCIHLTSIEASAVDNGRHQGDKSGASDIDISNAIGGGAASGAKVPLIDEPACPEIRQLCTEHVGLDATPLNEKRTLECIQTFLSSQLEALSDECQHAIWRHTLAFMDDRNVVRICSYSDGLEPLINE